MKKFIDFEKQSKKLYTNYYIDEYNLIIKVPINEEDDVIIEKFHLSKRVYLIHYE